MADGLHNGSLDELPASPNVDRDGMNIVIKNQHWDPDIELRLFHGEVCNHIPPTAPIDLFDVLVMLDLQPSRGQAKKNWRKEGGPAFPPGFHDWFIGKRKTRITVWFPVPV